MKSKHAMQNDAELDFFVFAVEAFFISKLIQWYPILLIELKKRNQSTVLKTASVTRWPSHEHMALAVSNQTSMKERSKKLHVSYLAKNPVGIIFVTFCPKASKHRQLIIRGLWHANNLACLKRLHKQNKALNKSPGTKAQGGGYSPILPIRGRAAGQGMVFGLSVLNRVQNFNRVCPK